MGQWNKGKLLEQRYELLHMLGQGGMSEVWLASDRRLNGKQWAVKKSRQSSAISNTVVMEEAKVMAELHHPNLPQVVDLFMDEGGAFVIVMEYIRGRNVRQWFDDNRRSIPVRDAVRLACELCDALAHLHNCLAGKLVYRDVKPSNLMLEEGGRLKLIDFGTVRWFKEGQDRDTIALGTAGFASPEQLSGEQTCPRSDVYSVGALLYYLLSGGEYYNGSGSAALLERHAEVSERLDAIVAKALSLRAYDRYASAGELKHALASSLGTEPRVAVGQIWTKRTVIAAASLYPGAGATSLCLLIASVLNAKGIPHAYMEAPSVRPELRARLGAGSDSESVQSGYTVWYMPEGNQSFEESLLSVREPIVLLDVRAYDEWAMNGNWMSYCHSIWFVAGCDSVKLHVHEHCVLRARDEISSGRASWAAMNIRAGAVLSALSERLGSGPGAVVPSLPEQAVDELRWNGNGTLHRWMTARGRLEHWRKPLAPIVQSAIHPASNVRRRLAGILDFFTKKG